VQPFQSVPSLIHDIRDKDHDIAERMTNHHDKNQSEKPLILLRFFKSIAINNINLFAIGFK
jgi:hypothetical protein